MFMFPRLDTIIEPMLCMGDIMARYRRKRTTKFVNAMYTEIVDLQTVAGKTSVIGFHTPIGVNPIKRLQGLYTQYGKVLYRGCSVTMVPAQNLPVDPLGLTGMVGTTDTMDPRDALNPILTHGCHGEHLGRILDNIYSEGSTYFGSSGSDLTPRAQGNSLNEENSDSLNKIDIPNATDLALSRFYQCLTDPSWKKHGIQDVLKLRLHPLVNRVVASNPIVPAFDFNIDGQMSTLVGLNPGAQDTTIYGDITPQPNSYVAGVEHKFATPLYNSTTGENSYPVVPQFFTNGVTRMGWMPTSKLGNDGITRFTSLPKQFMACMIMPPQYNCEQFFRLQIRHYYSFKEFTASLGNMEIDSPQASHDTNSYFNWIDYDETNVKTDSSFKSVTSMDMIDADASILADGAR